MASDNSTAPTAYEMVERYDFPRGILPEGVTGYVLRPNGSFEVYLPGDCDLSAANMQVHYSSCIAGNVQNRSIHGLEGVKVKMLFAWIGIDQVDRTEERIQFHAGMVSKLFPVDSFANSPQCN
ncbi:uncharacterized protein LOC133886311 [Phragmites australis]|uniref:uncharacterized protein LOC133886311 n=1 Tax=Phragmites australis TaxID=29695 RepID=UPI002D785840|nr:uncharacterized protein LOC133886311 [Phragmites australis]